MSKPLDLGEGTAANRPSVLDALAPKPPRLCFDCAPDHVAVATSLLVCRWTKAAGTPLLM